MAVLGVFVTCTFGEFSKKIIEKHKKNTKQFFVPLLSPTKENPGYTDTRVHNPPLFSWKITFYKYFDKNVRASATYLTPLLSLPLDCRLELEIDLESMQAKQ